MNSLFYFAYGSNLSIRRLQARVPSAVFTTTAFLDEHRLCFHKRNLDGSAKADIAAERAAEGVWGAVFRLLAAEQYLLDRAEGRGAGYEVKEVVVASERGEAYQCLTYFATDIDKSLKPYEWYLHHILTGAQEVGLPNDYVRQLELTEAWGDPDSERDCRERAIYLRG